MESGPFLKQLFADIVFYASLNFVGFYVRYVGEINMRRGFLDKRGCIDATFKLKYEKEQEVVFVVLPFLVAVFVVTACCCCCCCCCIYCHCCNVYL
jgi:hypothetical protein